MNDDNRRIAKNTIYLYSRMIVMMLVTLYTSCTILEKLGVDDYGIYLYCLANCWFLSFINGVLSTGTSRFLTFELGQLGIWKIETDFFHTTYFSYNLSTFIVFLAETGGTWFIYNENGHTSWSYGVLLYAFHLSILQHFIFNSNVPCN